MSDVVRNFYNISSANRDDAYDFVDFLRDEGIHVNWEPPDVDRGDFWNELIITIVATGSAETLKMAVDRFKARRPKTRVHEANPESETDVESS